MGRLDIRLNCTECAEFTEFTSEKDNQAVRCDECGKRHSDDSLHVVKPGKKYERDESGELLEEPP